MSDQKRFLLILLVRQRGWANLFYELYQYALGDDDKVVRLIQLKAAGDKYYRPGGA